MTPPNQSLHVVAIFRARPERATELRDLLLGLVEPTRGEAGCIRYDLTRDRNESNRFVFVEEWSSSEALEAHLQSAHIAAAKQRFPELLATDLELLRLDPQSER